MNTNTNSNNNNSYFRHKIKIQSKLYLRWKMRMHSSARIPRVHSATNKWKEYSNQNRCSFSTHSFPLSAGESLENVFFFSPDSFHVTENRTQIVCTTKNVRKQHEHNAIANFPFNVEREENLHSCDWRMNSQHENLFAHQCKQIKFSDSWLIDVHTAITLNNEILIMVLSNFDI